MDAPDTSWRPLGELFVERGLISEADLERALVEQSTTGQRLADILVRRGLVTGHDITSALMEQITSFDTSNGAHASEPLAPEPVFDVPGSAPEPWPAEYLTAELADEEPVDAEPLVEPAGGLADTPPEPPALEEVVAEEQTTVAPSSLEDVGVEPDELIRENDAQRLDAESRLAALGQISHGLAQIRVDLEAQELCTAPLGEELTATQERVGARRGELEAEIALLKQTRTEIESAAAELEHVRGELTGKIHDLAELKATAAMWTARVTDLEAEIGALTQRANIASRTLGSLAATAVPTPGLDASIQRFDNPDEITEPASVAPPAGHGYLLLIPRDEGHDLIECDGAPPSVGETLDVSGEAWVVTKTAPSPLPFDDRACVFLAGV